MSDLSVQTRWMDATDQAELVRSGQVTALELLDAAIERIEAADPAINAVVMRWFDQARRTATGVLPDGVFRGVPFLLKDWGVSRRSSRYISVERPVGIRAAGPRVSAGPDGELGAGAERHPE